MKKINEYKKQIEVSNNEPIDFDSLPFEQRKAIIEELERGNKLMAKRIAKLKKSDIA